jgi:hypothetical protein
MTAPRAIEFNSRCTSRRGPRRGMQAILITCPTAGGFLRTAQWPALAGAIEGERRQ